MNRREFNLIAETINALPQYRSHIHTTTTSDLTAVVRFDVLVSRLADALRTTNPHFDRERFITACNGKESNGNR